MRKDEEIADPVSEVPARLVDSEEAQANRLLDVKDGRDPFELLLKVILHVIGVCSQVQEDIPRASCRENHLPRPAPLEVLDQLAVPVQVEGGLRRDVDLAVVRR